MEFRKHYIQVKTRSLQLNLSPKLVGTKSYKSGVHEISQILHSKPQQRVGMKSSCWYSLEESFLGKFYARKKIPFGSHAVFADIFKQGEKN